MNRLNVAVIAIARRKALRTWSAKGVSPPQ